MKYDKGEVLKALRQSRRGRKYIPQSERIIDELISNFDSNERPNSKLDRSRYYKRIDVNASDISRVQPADHFQCQETETHEATQSTGSPEFCEKDVEWDATPSRIPTRDEIITRLVQDAEDDALKFLISRQKTREVSATVTGSMACHFKRIVEQFENEDGTIELKEITQYLDQHKVSLDGRDRHIYARVTRLAKTKLDSNKRNRIADIVAGACLLGIHSEDFYERCKRGFEVGDKKKISTGPSALGRYYREYESAQSATVSLRDGQITGDREDAQGGTGDGEIVNWTEAVRVLSDALSSDQVPAHFRSRGGRMVKIGRIVHGKNGIVFEAA